VRRKPEVLILVLIAVLFSFGAAQATAPIAKEIPDIRNAINGAGVTAAVTVNLDEYVIDPDDRTANGLQDSSTLIWGENSTIGDDNVSVTANDLQVDVPAQGAPAEGQSTFVVTDKDADQDFAGPVTVKTTTLLAAPLVDDYLGAAGPANSAIPYGWCIDPLQTLRIEPGVQPGGGGRLFISHSSGVGESCFYGASTVLDASGQLAPRAPYNDPVTLRGLLFGSGSSVGSLQTANLSSSANLNGGFVEGLAGFSNWARVTVTRKYGDGSTDSYSVAIADSLEGSATDLDGFSFTGVPTAAGLAGSEDFEGITVQDLIGAADSAAFNTEFASDIAVNTARAAQTTSWDVRPLNPNDPNSRLSPLSIEVGPMATFPGATSGRALKVDFTQQDGQGIIAFHKGIPPSSYNPGDVLTFSINTYFNLGYDGANDDAINDGQNGFVFAIALGDALTLSLGNFNYMDFPPSDAAVQGGVPDGVANYTNKEAFLHGKWSRHQVSWRVPEIGQSVSGGPAGTGNLVDPTGVGAAWTVQRSDTATPVNQTVWLDNLCIAACPGPLCLALGAIQAPMISAGFAFEYDGANSLFYTPNHAQPAALNRGATINGNFSTNAGTSSGAFPVAGATTFSRAAENAGAGWITSAVASAPAYVTNGGPTIALGFPIGFDDSLAAFSTATTVSRTKTPYLDLGLVDQGISPGLHVDTVAFAGGSGGGPATLNQVVDNVSGIFGVRFSARTDGAAPADNAGVNVVLSNADVNNGMVSQVGPQMLPNGADAAGAGVVWADYFLEGSVHTFHSPQVQTVAQGLGVALALNADNPSAQLAQIEVIRASYAAGVLGLQNTFLGNGYEAFLGEVTTIAGTAPQNAALPGATGDANMFVDEVGLYTVRDTGAYYDEDLTLSGLLP
jgi:hypothetical protein